MNPVRADRIHLTLLFLGEQPERRLSKIREVLQESTHAFGSLTLQTGSLGGFPHPNRARVVFLNVRDRTAPPQLHALARSIREHFQALEIQDNHAFHPHLTLARIRRGTISLPEVIPPTWNWHVQSVSLYQSTLTPGGPRYTILDTFPLQP